MKDQHIKEAEAIVLELGWENNGLAEDNDIRKAYLAGRMKSEQEIEDLVSVMIVIFHFNILMGSG